jgi:hypothetical protein
MRTIRCRSQRASARVDRAVEFKCRADGFRELYGWLDDRDILIVKADRQEPLDRLQNGPISSLEADPQSKAFPE